MARRLGGSQPTGLGRGEGQVWFRNRVANPIVRLLLRSPLHPLLSGAVLLLTYTGRRSGRRYTIPVQYARTDRRVVIWPADHQRKRWWRNLSSPAPVELRIRGRTVHGTAQAVTDDHDAIQDTLTTYLQRFPRAARALALDSGSPDTLRGADRTVVVRVDLDPADC